MRPVGEGGRGEQKGRQTYGLRSANSRSGQRDDRVPCCDPLCRDLCVTVRSQTSQTSIVAAWLTSKQTQGTLPVVQIRLLLDAPAQGDQDTIRIDSIASTPCLRVLRLFRGGEGDWIPASSKERKESREAPGGDCWRPGELPRPWELQSRWRRRCAAAGAPS